jgi:hypothetical protein
LLPFLELRKVKGVYLSDTKKLQLRSELEPVPLVSGLTNPSMEWQELTAPFNKRPAAPPESHTPLNIKPDDSPSDPSMLQFIGLKIADFTRSVSDVLKRASTPLGRKNAPTKGTPKGSPQPADNMGSIINPPIDSAPRNLQLISPQDRHATRSQSQQKLGCTLNDDLTDTQATTGQPHRPNKDAHKDFKSPSGEEGWSQTRKSKKKRARKPTVPDCRRQHHIVSSPVEHRE